MSAADNNFVTLFGDALLAQKQQQRQEQQQEQLQRQEVEFEDLDLNYLDGLRLNYAVSGDVDQGTTDMLATNVLEALQSDQPLELTPRGTHVASTLQGTQYDQGGFGLGGWT